MNRSIIPDDVLGRAAAGAVLLAVACGVDERRPMALAEPSSEGVSPTGDPLLGQGSEGEPAQSLDAPASGRAAPELVLAAGRVLQATPTAIDFGNVPRGLVSSLAVGIRNAGDTAIDQLDFLLGGGGSEAYSVSHEGCPASLAPGRDCVAIVAFAPQAERAWEASLIVTGAETQQARVPLVGLGVRPGSLVVEGTGFSFGEHEVGIPSETRTAIVRNTGELATGPLALVNPVPDEFRAETDCGPALLPGGSCTVQVQYLAARRGFPVERLTLGDGVANEVILGVSGRARARLTIQFAGEGTGTITSDTGLECTSDCSILIETFTALTATTSNGSNTVFTGWSTLPGCDARRQCTVLIDTPVTTVVTFAAQTHNLAFVSSELFPSNLGGAAPYDAACNRLASEAGINDGSGTAFVAAVSSPASFWDRMVAGARGWRRMDGLPMGDTPESFARDGAAPQYPLVFDERGEVTTGLVQTGSTVDGELGDNCSDWTEASGAFLALGDSSSGPGWLVTTRRPCGTNEASVYCLGARRTAPLPAMPFAGKRFWVTREPLLMGEQSPDEACQLDRPAGVARAIALVGYSDRRALDLLDPSATYVRPDGALMGTAERIRVQGLLTGPWLTSDGALLTGADDVWTGGNPGADPTLEQTCNDWTDPLGQGVTGFATHYDFSAFGTSQILSSCASAARVYCIEV